jgi:hypothetical protein
MTMKLSELNALIEKTKDIRGDCEVMGYSYEAAEAFPLHGLDEIFVDREDLFDDELGDDVYPENTLFLVTS